MNDSTPLAKAKLIVEAALDLKAERPVVLDVRKLTAYADTFVILSGRSDRQVRSISDAIVHALKANDDQPLGVEGLEDGNWVLIDCNDAIVHVFDPETRDRYDLERLWRDAPRLALDGLVEIEPGSDAFANGDQADEADEVAQIEEERADPAA